MQGQAVWEVLLQLAVREGMDALVDCGALLAGTSNRWVGRAASALGVGVQGGDR